MIVRQYKVWRCTSMVLAFLVLAAPALFGHAPTAAPTDVASPAPCTETGLVVASSPTSGPEQVRRMLLPGDDPVLTPEIMSSRPLEIVPETRLPRNTHDINETVASYRWDSSLWGRLDCLRQQRIRQGLFGARAQRCSLG
jgi:hypothetical protein